MAEKELATKLVSLVGEMKSNLCGLVEEWKKFQSEVEQEKVIAVHEKQPEMVMVRKADLERLVTEAMMMKEYLPKVLCPEYLHSISKLTQSEQELHAVARERDRAKEEQEHMKRRVEIAMADFEQEKQEKHALKCEAASLSDQLNQQFDFWASMGTVCWSMLWRLSQREDTIPAILSGSKVTDFLLLVTNTLTSYCSADSEEDLPDSSSQEAQFVLALCGTLTNITASAYGREFIAGCEIGQELIDALCYSLSKTPTGPKCEKLKGLIMMTLYNISINQSGLAYLRAKPDLLKEFVWLLQEESSMSNKLHIIRLLQSMVLEPENQAVAQRVVEAIPAPLLQHLTTSPNSEIREAAQELLTDLLYLQREH